VPCASAAIAKAKGGMSYEPTHPFIEIERRRYTYGTTATPGRA
jgi:hypothetical protein